MFGMLIDKILYISLRLFIWGLNRLPLGTRISCLSRIINLIGLLSLGHRRVAHKNLSLAFPSSDLKWRENVIKESYTALARLIVDFARLHTINEAWVKEHVECPLLSNYQEIKLKNPGKGVILATGHLGSFELMAHCMPMFGHPINFVVRNFKLETIDRWWRSVREAKGNRVIFRKGALRDLLETLASGVDVALLFDQNVRRKHAVFVPWFGRIAATTKALGMAALRTEAPIFVASMQYIGHDRYRINAREFDFSNLYRDSSIPYEDKILKITSEVSNAYQEMIKNDPAAWFWMHRRWKTTPPGVEENFYD